MTTKQKLVAARLAKQLSKLSQLADANELTLGNGGEVGAILGGVATELELMSEGLAT